jgi:hypothetical protein
MDDAEEELERIALPHGETAAPRTGKMALETDLGAIEIGVAEPLLTLIRKLQAAESPAQAATLLAATDAQLDTWQSSRWPPDASQEKAVLPCGMELRLPREL